MENTSSGSRAIGTTRTAAGSEIVQFYVSKPNSRIFRPLKERKGFAKVRLEPGESRSSTGT